MDDILIGDVIDAVDGMRGEIVAAVSRAVAIQSVSPTRQLSPTERFRNWDLEGDEVAPGGEQQVSLYMQELLEDSGLQTELVSVEDGRPNVGARLPGQRGGRSLMFVGHVDVVPAGPSDGWSVDPWSASLAEDRIYGRGTADMKAGDVCAIFACRSLRQVEVRLSGDLMVALAVGEEAMDTARGIGSLLDAGYSANAAIVMEPTAELHNGLNVASESRGQLLFRILIHGLPVHVSYRGHPPRYALGQTNEGVSAIEKAQVVQQALLDLDHAWQRSASVNQPHWRPTVYPVAIEGGTSMRATTPERCELWYSTFFRADQDPDAVESEIHETIFNAASADAWLEEHRPQVQRVMLWPPFSTRTDSAIVGTLAAATAKVQGPGTLQTGVGYVCDATFVKAHGIDTVVCGPGEIRVAHSFDESVDVEQLIVATKAYALTAIEWCGRHGS